MKFESAVMMQSNKWKSWDFSIPSIVPGTRDTGKKCG